MRSGPLTFSLDVEDHRPHGGWPERFPALTRQILEFVAEREVRGTVFIVGQIAETHPDLVRDVVAAGHEIALHAWEHTPLTDVTPAAFREGTRKGRELLEDLAGAPVVGYRAPTASVTPRTAWVPDALGELGFEYSSSVVPAHNPLYGWPGAPRSAFRWPNGLCEFPLPVNGVGPFALPVLGGVYFRVIPWAVTKVVRRYVENASVPVMYCHPYDFDTDEPRWAVPGVGRAGVELLWYNRKAMFTKLDKLLASCPIGPPLVERMGELDDAVTFSPDVLRTVADR